MNPLQTKTWKELEEHYAIIKNIHMKDMFSENPERFSDFSLRFKDILVDYSKNIINEDTMKLLIQLADEMNVKDAVHKIFSGDAINETEDRAVLHTALRNRGNTPISVDGRNVMQDVNAVLQKMEKFSQKIISGEWKGYTGKPIKDIVNIGIGGSDLGPVMETISETSSESALCL
jgi:glucose-6-phosphate isomerase